MKEILVKKRFVLCFLFIQATAYCQTGKPYFQQKVDYQIEVSLNAAEKELDGFINIHYQNNSPDTLTFIWFHLWPNAFKNDRTAFSEQLLQLGRTHFYFSKEDQKGFINKLNFKADGVTAMLEDHPQYIEVAKLMLPTPLLPGKQVSITTPFHVKIPYNFSRGGYVENTFQITQWYPKPAVYDRKGWHPMPYLDQGEFYSEFGTFDVKITVPEDYIIAATGEAVARNLSSSAAVNRQLEQHEPASITDKKDPVIEYNIEKEKTLEAGGKKKKKPVSNKPLIGIKTKELKNNSTDRHSSGKRKTYYFRQENVHDFAWFADKNFLVKEDTLQLPSGRIMRVAAYYLPESKEVWKNSLVFLKEALLTRSHWLGEYPYPTAKAVETKMSFSGGMEYPTITNISPVEDEKTLDLIIEHEIGHNWNYGILASNERDHPWMDEGLNTYFDNRYEALQYPHNNSPVKEHFLSRRLPDNFMDIGLRTLIANKNDQVIETKSEDFSLVNYNLVAYYKTGEWVSALENYLGEKDFDKAIKEYYHTWKFKHPYPEDFREIMEKSSGKNLDSLFSLLTKKGSLTAPPVNKQIKFQTFFSFKETNRYDYLFFSPAIGINQYDKFMFGGLVHNYTLPEPKFHFFATPMYATGSKTLAGMARAGYNIMSYGAIRKTEIALSAAKYSINDFTDSSGHKHIMGFHKIVPSIKFIFKNKNARSNILSYAQWKTYFIEETGLLFSRDTVAQLDIISLPKSNRYLNQLTFSLENHRKLYPFSTRLVAEQGIGFARLAFDGNYYFNYARGGGMGVRLFAGKFFYLGGQSTYNQYQYKRYHLNMTGANGYEDYTYSNYFIGRNEFEKFPSQQIMIRDGGFKVRTDLLNTKVGTSDNWLGALNFKTDFPRDFNPLQVLPFKIPLKIFLDIGTYAEAWQKEADTEKFIFDAGLQLSLFNDILNIYVPLIYSKVYSQYFKSTIPKDKRFLKNISFSIDIQKFRFNQWAGIPAL